MNYEYKRKATISTWMKFSSLDRLDKEKLLLKTALLLEGEKKTMKLESKWDILGM